MRTVFFTTAFCLLSGLAALPRAVRADDFDYSHLDATWISIQPDRAPSGNGEKLDLDYALSDGAFMYWGATHEDLASVTLRRYDFGVGIHTWGNDAYSFFTNVSWNHLGTEPTTGPGQQDHGFGLSGGVRLRPADDWEIYLLGRYEHNDVLPVHASGELGLWYSLTSQWAVGASVSRSAVETDSLIGLRWYY